MNWELVLEEYYDQVGLQVHASFPVSPAFSSAGSVVWQIIHIY